MPAASAPARQRADAAQNRTLLLQAAEEIFSELGVQAPLEAVSTRAGVGRATLFRNFPDRQSLVMALLQRGLDNVAAEAERLADSRDGLVQLLRFVLERMVLRAPLVEYWQSAGRQRPEIQAAIERVIDIFTPITQRAVAARRCRPDLVPQDVLPLLALFSGALCGCSPDQRAALAERTWAFAMDIVKPSAPRRARPATRPNPGPTGDGAAGTQ